MSLATRKLHKAKESLNRAIKEYEGGMKRESIGSINYVKNNCVEALYLILAEIEQEQNN